MVRLPEDVIVEILSRVSAKDIARFRCVCKHWLSLTNDSNLIKLHLHRSIQNNSLNLILVCYSWQMWSLTNPPTTKIYSWQNNSFEEYIEIETPPFDVSSYGLTALSCNGLVCLLQRRNLLLVNPTTREYKFVKFYNELESERDEVGGVAKYGHDVYRVSEFQSAEFGVVIEYGEAVYGLGYDSIIDDYKFVQFISYTCQVQDNVTGTIMCACTRDSKIVVHSLNDSSPCVTISNIPYFIEMDECGVYLDGAVHWVGKPAEAFKPLHGRVIISFDVTEKVIREFSLPDVVDENSQLSLSVLGRKLCIFLNSNFEMWVMKTYGACGSWYKLASIDKTVFTSQLLHRGSWFSILPTARPLCFSKCGGILVSCADKLFLYDPKQNTTRNVEIRGITEGLGITTITTSIASCVSLKSGTYFPV